MRDRTAISIVLFLLTAVSWGQQQPSGGSAQSGGSQSMPGMDMPAHDMSNMKDMPMDANKDSDAGMHAMHSMEGHMDMGPHMKMTALRPSRPGDAERAQFVVDAARKASTKYLDYHVALADGFKIFHPEIPQKMYHFTNYQYAFEAAFSFNAEHPTSLLYEKRGDDYKLIGVMYTAPKRFGEDQLDERVPLSVAQWHEHVNFCAAPAERKMESLMPHPQFGLRGSITTQEACDAAGGTFHPVVFNWMVHVYPFEKDQASIWSVSRQHGDAD
ncbi:MAG TPA: hypothetical protein VFF50_01070 [Candidatus Deferrimicrobiaceae bacterium]|nr:hypothetical protein [Candidatus Deferrimicrobiaceae bacterium]